MPALPRGSRRTALLLTAGLIIAGHMHAQPTFMRMFSNGYESRAVREVNGNAYTVAGGTDLYANWHWHMMSPIPTTKVHMYQTDVNGVAQWERTYGRLDERCIAVWMEPCLDGGFIITGSMNRDRIWPPDSNDVMLIKTDANGNLTWSKRYDGGKDEWGHCVRPTPDGGFIFSGFLDVSPIGGPASTFALLVKTDGNGTVQWSRRYPLALRDMITHEPFTYVVRPLAGGGYVIVGTGIGSMALGVLVIRTDANGDLVWSNVYEHDASVLRYSTGLEVLETSNGDLLIAGSMDKLQPIQPNYPYLLRLNSAGATLHARFYETAPFLPFQSGFSSVINTSDGGYFFTGMGGYSSFGDQAQLLKTDAALTVQWSRVYSWDGVATMGSRSGRQTMDGGYVFAGKRQFSGSVLLKTNSQGLIACKDPTVLVENVPSLLVQNRVPVPLTGISASDALLIQVSPLLNSTTPCPLEIVLPIELVSFTADALPDRMAGLKWVTASETNCDHFTVERSTDAVHFEDVISVAGAGHSAQGAEYGFVDEHPLAVNVSYYRLREVDRDGAETFSDIVPVMFEGSPLQVLNAVIDQADGSLHLTVHDPRSLILGFSLCDLSGRMVAVGQLNHHRGIQEHRIDVPLKAALYLLMLSDERTTTTVKMTVAGAP